MQNNSKTPRCDKLILLSPLSHVIIAIVFIIGAIIRLYLDLENQDFDYYPETVLALYPSGAARGLWPSFFFLIPYSVSFTIHSNEMRYT
jgi:hypothetical protein